MPYQNQRIRRLNDEARMYLTDGTIFLTRGVSDLPIKDQAAILEHVRTFDQFTPDNDPYGEHDFGTFEHNGRRICWKIGCYNRQMQYGSPDPADSCVTKRVLTVMLASEC
jgi:hypothetical protein